MLISTKRISFFFLFFFSVIINLVRLTHGLFVSHFFFSPNLKHDLTIIFLFFFFMWVTLYGTMFARLWYDIFLFFFFYNNRIKGTYCEGKSFDRISHLFEFLKSIFINCTRSIDTIIEYKQDFVYYFFFFFNTVKNYRKLNSNVHIRRNSFVNRSRI